MLSYKSGNEVVIKSLAVFTQYTQMITKIFPTYVILLLHESRAKSFEHLRIIEGKTYSIFKNACNALGLLNDDSEWYNTLVEAAIFQTPAQLRGCSVAIFLYIHIVTQQIHSSYEMTIKLI